MWVAFCCPHAPWSTAHFPGYLTCPLSPGSVWGQPSVLRRGPGRPACSGEGAAAGSCRLCGQRPDGAPPTAESQTSHHRGRQVRLGQQPIPLTKHPPGARCASFCHLIATRAGGDFYLHRGRPKAVRSAVAQGHASREGESSVRPGSNPQPFLCHAWPPPPPPSLPGTGHHP